MNLKEKLYQRLKTVTLYSAGQMLSVFSVLLLSLFIIKFHSVTLWGSYAELLIWTNFFLIFLSFGSYGSLLKSFSSTPSKVNQLWVNNLLTRSILLIPSIILITYIPLFNDVEVWVILLILFQFLTQSFKVLVVFHREFKLSIFAEITFNLVLLGLLVLKIKTLDLNSLIQIICLAYFFKSIIYSTFLIKGFSNIHYSFSLKELSISLPFFIPMLVGTVQIKMDMYYGSHFFDTVTLSKYQILINFLMLAQMGSSFIVTPFIRIFYRSKDTLIQTIQNQFFYYGWAFSLVAVGIIYLMVNFIYGFEFNWYQYLLVFLFIVPLLLHITLINEYYKKNLQYKVVVFASIIVFIQLFLGYFLIMNFEITGALSLKVIGQWLTVLILWVWMKRNNRG